MTAEEFIGHSNGDRRSVIIVQGRTWETTPKECTYGDLNRWEWVTGIEEEYQSPMSYLVCPKCGLDGT